MANESHFRFDDDDNDDNDDDDDDDDDKIKYTIIIRKMGKLSTHSPIYCKNVNENWLNVRHALARMHLTSILEIQYL